MQTKIVFFPFVIDIGNLVTKVPFLIHQISVISKCSIPNTRDGSQNGLKI